MGVTDPHLIIKNTKNKLQKYNYNWIDKIHKRRVYSSHTNHNYLF